MTSETTLYVHVHDSNTVENLAILDLHQMLMGYSDLHYGGFEPRSGEHMFIGTLGGNPSHTVTIWIDNIEPSLKQYGLAYLN